MRFTISDDVSIVSPQKKDIASCVFRRANKMNRTQTNNNKNDIRHKKSTRAIMGLTNDKWRYRSMDLRELDSQNVRDRTTPRILVRAAFVHTRENLSWIATAETEKKNKYGNESTARFIIP